MLDAPVVKCSLYPRSIKPVCFQEIEALPFSLMAINKSACIIAALSIQNMIDFSLRLFTHVYISNSAYPGSRRIAHINEIWFRYTLYIVSQIDPWTAN